MNCWDDYHELYNRYRRLESVNLTFAYLTGMWRWRPETQTSQVFLYRMGRNEDDRKNQTNAVNKMLHYIKDVPPVFKHPQTHLRQEEVVRVMEKVTRINKRTIRHLAAHSEHWKTSFPDVYPMRLLTPVWEDDFALYENVAAVTLIKYLDAAIRQQYIDVVGDLSATWNESDQAPGSLPGCIWASYKEIYDRSLKSNHLQDIKDKLEQLRAHINTCKHSKLFRSLYNAHAIVGALKPTNIFLKNRYYHKVYLLWKIKEGLRKNAKADSYQTIQNPQYEKGFGIHAKLLLLFTLKTFGFTPLVENSPVLVKDSVQKMVYKHGNWLIELSEPDGNPLVVKCRFMLYQTHTVVLPVERMLNLNEKEQAQFTQQFHIAQIVNNRELIFKAALTPEELEEFRRFLIEKWQINNRDNAGKNQVNQIKNEVAKFPKPRILTVYFEVSFDPAPQDKKEIPTWFAKYQEKIQGEDIWVKLLPNKLWDFPQDYGDKMFLFVSFPTPNTRQRFHVVPVSLNDIHSYRRIMKILLPFLLELDDTHCPYCAGELNADGHCYKCNIVINKTQCGQCHNERYSSAATDPRCPPLNLDSSIRESKKYQLQLLEEELKTGFLNVMPIKEGEVMCPHCLGNEIKTLQEQYLEMSQTRFANASNHLSK